MTLLSCYAAQIRFFNTSDIHLITAGNYHVRVWQFDLPNKKLRPTQVASKEMNRIAKISLVTSNPVVFRPRNKDSSI